MTSECLEECDDLILWFSEGQYVYKAMELKMQSKTTDSFPAGKVAIRQCKDVRGDRGDS